jgi:hypothetical protein
MIRYSLRRNIKAPNKLNLLTKAEHYGFRITVNKAIKKFGDKAKSSIRQELSQLLEKNVFIPVDSKHLTNAQLKSAIRSHMFLKEKHLPSGDFDKLKSRFVAGGNEQDKSLYDDISSSTASTETVFLIATIAAHERRVVITVDITGA